MLAETHPGAGRGRVLLRKPIILILVSIIEAVLYDFHRRIRIFAWEGVQNVGYVVADYVRGERLDELEKLIVSAKKHDFLRIGRAMLSKYDRGPGFNYVGDFVLPWDPYFPD